MADTPITNAAIVLPTTLYTPTTAPVVPTKLGPIPAIVTPASKPTAVAPVAAKPTLSTAVNAAVASTVKLPKGLSLFNTNDLDKGYFAAVVYSETSARKTSTAAQFGSPEDVRIILTRKKEQMIPLKDQGYEVALVEDAESMLFALQFPEKLWPEWAKNPNRTLVLDDITEGVAMLLDENSEIDGKEVKDRRRSYTAAGDDLREALKIARKKPQHFILVALAKVKDDPLNNEERIGPDMPPSMLNLVLTEFEFVLYIKTGTWKMLTDRDFVAIKTTDPNTNKEKVIRRQIFAKSKLPLSLIGKGVLNKEEPLDLKALWNKVLTAKATVAPGVKK